MSYTYDDMSPTEFRNAWAADAAARGCRCDQLAAVDREADRILSMSDSELSDHLAGQGLTIEGEAAKARTAFARAEHAVATRHRGICLVLVGPSGSGKTSIMRHLLHHEHRLHPSVSVTTRQPRQGEFHDVDYSFVTRKAFQELQAADGLLEHTEYAGQLYGTRRRETEVLLAAGVDLVFVLDANGAGALQRALPGDVVAVFVQPPSTEEVRTRMLARGDLPETVERRLETDYDLLRALRAKQACQHVVVNRDLDTAVREVRRILRRARDARVNPEVRREGLDALATLTEECDI